MKEQRFEKVIEWNFESIDVLLIQILFFGGGTIFGYFTSSLITLIIGFIFFSFFFLVILKKVGYVFRKVYWRKT